MKKFFAMLLTLVMALSLVACGGSSTDAPAEDTSDDAAQEEVQTSTGSGEELTFTTGGSSGVGSSTTGGTNVAPAS